MTFAPGVCLSADGRLEVFVRGGALDHIFQTAPNNGWSSWQNLDGSLAGAPAAMTGVGGRLELFATGPDNSLRHIVQSAPGQGWSNWRELGGPGASGTNTTAGRGTLSGVSR